MDRRRKHLHTAAYIVSVLIALAVGFLAFRYGRYHSGNALLSQAREEAADGRYAKAAETVGRIISLRDSRVEVSAQELLLMKADYEYNAGEYSEAAQSATELVSDTGADSDLSGQGAEIVIESCRKNGDYEQIAAFLHDYKDRPFADTYSVYQSEAPDIDPESGSYEENTKVTIKGGKNGDIYYTTDGTDPSLSSQQYQSAIVLEKGSCRLRAVYVNSYGVTSTETRRDYTILSEQPDPPVVSPESGVYTSAGKITAEGDADCEIRYTDDGTKPDAHSKLYEDPIDMPAGSTTFRFVCVTGDGVVSDEVSRTYSFRSKTMPDTSDGSDLIRDALSVQAQALVKQELAAGKTLDEIRGQTSTESGAKKKSDKKSSPSQEDILFASYHYYNPASYYYSYIREITLTGKTYYLYEETFVNSAGGSVKTDSMFAVEISSSQVFAAEESSPGFYRLGKLSVSDISERADSSDTADTAAASVES